MKIAEYNQMMAYLTRPEPLPQPKPEELLDLQEALDKQIITEQEFDKLREGIINGNQEFVIE